jgi:ATP-dependent Clp protease ATP-binding subunit ClpB
VIAALQKTKEQIEQTRIEIERAERQADLEKVARLRYGTLRELEKKLAEAEQQLKDAPVRRRRPAERGGRR